MLDTCLEAMGRTRGHAETQVFPSSPGFYAIYLVKGDRIGDVHAVAIDPVYVGTSGDLRQREAGTNFASSKTGLSTVRRTLGAHLKQELALRAICRNEAAATRLT